MCRSLSRRLIRFANFALLFAAVLAISSHAGVLQLFGSIVEYIAPIVWPQPPIIQPGTAGGPPSDAVVLFDGKDMSAFKDGQDWKVEDGCAIAAKHDIDTKQAFGDCQVHVEWATPEKVAGRGQGRGNSGVFMMGLYEIQILDSYNNDTYYDGQVRRGLQAASAHGQRLPQAGRVADLRHHLGGPQVRQAGQAPQAGLRDRAAQRRGGAEPLRAHGRDLLVPKSRTTRPIPTSCRCACSSTATRSASATSGSARSRTSSASPATTRTTRDNEIRNPNFEIRNKFETQKPNCQRAIGWDKRSAGPPNCLPSAGFGRVARAKCSPSRIENLRFDGQEFHQLVEIHTGATPIVLVRRCALRVYQRRRRIRLAENTTNPHGMDRLRVDLPGRLSMALANTLGPNAYMGRNRDINQPRKKRKNANIPGTTIGALHRKVKSEGTDGRLHEATTTTAKISEERARIRSFGGNAMRSSRRIRGT